MSIPALTGRGLFVFSDPGGAKPLLSFININELQNCSLVISDRLYDFYEDFKIPVINFNIEMNVESQIKKINPDYLFTATSYKSDIELRFIKAAKYLGIQTYSFVDHWTNISKRFILNNQILYPDKVLLLDDRAKNIAIQEGIHDEIIEIIGNPYHLWIKNYAPKISKTNFISQIGNQFSNKKLLLFVPDPLSNINGIELYGFDEITVSKQLIDLFKKNKISDWIILFKPHPNQDASKLSQILLNQEIVYVLPQNIDTNTALFYADVVMGFFSSILIEANILQKNILRYLPSKTNYIDPIADLNLGIDINENSLIEALSKYK